MQLPVVRKTASAPSTDERADQAGAGPAVAAGYKEAVNNPTYGQTAAHDQPRHGRVHALLVTESALQNFPARTEGQGAVRRCRGTGHAAVGRLFAD